LPSISDRTKRRARSARHTARRPRRAPARGYDRRHEQCLTDGCLLPQRSGTSKLHGDLIQSSTPAFNTAEPRRGQREVTHQSVSADVHKNGGSPVACAKRARLYYSSSGLIGLWKRMVPTWTRLRAGTSRTRPPRPSAPPSAATTTHADAASVEGTPVSGSALGRTSEGVARHSEVANKHRAEVAYDSLVSSRFNCSNKL
jgi:hypothetical protein